MNQTGRDKAAILLPHLATRPYLIETGTFYGETARAVVAEGFGVTTIDNDPNLRAVVPGATILHGNSVDLLPGVLDAAPAPAVVFLDAHSITEPHVGPLQAELAILRDRDRGDVIVVDDARFLGMYDWPTLADIEAQWTGHEVTVEDGVVKIVPCEVVAAR